MTCFMRLGARPVRRAVRRDTCVSGNRHNAAGRVPRCTEGREKFATGGVAIRLWYKYHGANRSYPVTNFSPVKQVNINDPWYKLNVSALGGDGNSNTAKVRNVGIRLFGLVEKNTAHTALPSPQVAPESWARNFWWNRVVMSEARYRA